ncbi:MAG TPA: response regulator transcription factor [Flavisolibacter sp.]
MKHLFSKNIIWLSLAAAVLIFAIRFFESGFNTGQISTKIYITIIGIIFLGVGAFAAVQMVKRKTIVHYIEKEPQILVQPNDLLTDRECEILKGIARGLTNKEIGEQLFVSENTVKKHIANIYFKLDVNRRTQAVAKAKELKILSE